MPVSARVDAMLSAKVPFSLDLTRLRAAYADGLTPTRLVDALAPALVASDALGVWITRVDIAELLAGAKRIEREMDKDLPLWGVPFAVKDNIDVAGLPTTCACPAYARVAREDAFVVEQLRAAGALVVGKTNLDQFATGLVGVRSPYGAPPNPFDPRHVTGGSSSGSAAAVARGLVSFALGTDTAGSGRIPAGFNNVVGLKPSPGLLSTHGVVPACRSLDCVSVFALSVDDAQRVCQIAGVTDPRDPYSRIDASRERVRWRTARRPSRFRVGVPTDQELGHADGEVGEVFARVVDGVKRLGGEAVAVDLTPFLAASRLLYEGPWIAERLEGLADFVRERGPAMWTITRDILLAGARVSGIETFAGQHELAALKRHADRILSAVDALLLPTAPTHPTLADVAHAPVEVNLRLGRYASFVNLLDLAALAVPAGRRPSGLPSGVTLVGPWGSDDRLASLGAALHALLGDTLGATAFPLPAPARPEPVAADELGLVVVGAHLEGLPLNPQLTSRGGRLVAATRTAPTYRLYELPGTRPARPGLVRVNQGGAAIDVELWAVPRHAVGDFLARVPRPLALGRVELEDGAEHTGFLCEVSALVGARDITAYGGWRRYLSNAA
jgi:allophanate hydrolase